MENQVTLEVEGIVDRPISPADIRELLERTPTNDLHERHLINAIMQHFRDCVIGTADDNEDGGTSHTPTGKPTIKERMDYAKSQMRDNVNEHFYYWTGYFVALTEIRNGDMQDYERPW